MSQPTGTPARILVAGAGAFGITHIRNLAGLPGADLVGVADLDGARAEAAATVHGVPHWGTDAVELIAGLEPDGVIVATPGATHRDIAAAALRAGVHALVEKPVATKVADLDAIASATGSAMVLPGHILRFSRAHQELARVAHSGALGPLMSVTSRRYRDDHHIGAYPDIDPVLLTMIHDIDLALWITGEPPERIWAARTAPPPRHGETRMTGITASGTIWTLSTAWTFDSASTPPDRIEVVGERGSIEWQGDLGFVTHGPTATPEPVAESDDEILRSELNHFLECIATGRESKVVTLADARTGLLVAEEVMSCLTG